MKGVSFIITTLNAQRSLDKSLSSISTQKFDKSKFEVLILDGGSTDQTKNIAQRYSKIINIQFISAGMKENQEGRRLLGFNKSKFDYICILDSDNYLDQDDWVSQMTRPLDNNPELIASYTKYYHYDLTQTLFNRYLALIGGTDPVVYYMGKADRQPWVDTSLNQVEILKFDKSNFPTLGSNGTIIRKSMINLKSLTPESFFHTDILYDLLDEGKNTYARVNTKLLHDTGSTFVEQIIRRYKYMNLHHLKMLAQRRYKIFDSQKSSDWMKLLNFIFITLTLVIPTIDAIKGYFKTRDFVWFLHPVYCFIYLFSYGYAVIKHDR
ncbi:glycosyltransferase family 2 protein [Candidatus Amesbacteria bacterium]|nr:glycosyltransferase family 2 protein [Candidatus Amesbacteria bacterium]